MNRRGILYIFIAAGISLVANATSGILLPKFLSIDTYAQIALYQLYITYVGLLHFGYSDGIYLRYGGISIKSINAHKIYEEFKTFKVFQFAVTLSAVLISILLQDQFLLIIALSIFPINVANYLRNLYQATGEFARYAKFTNVNTLTIFILNLILLFIIKSDYYIVYIAAYLVAWILYWIILEMEMGKIVKREKTTYRFSHITSNIREGYSLMVGGFSVVVLSGLDRLFVKIFIGLTEFAFFAFAANMQSLMNVFVTPIATTMYNLFSKVQSIERITSIKNTNLLLSGLLITAAFPVSFFVENYMTEFRPSLDIIFILFAAQFFIMNIRMISTNIFKSLRRQKDYLKTVVTVLIASVILNFSFYLISPTITSIAFGTLISSSLWLAISEKYLPEFRYPKEKILFIIITLVTFITSGMYLSLLVGLLVYLVVLILSSFILMRAELAYAVAEFMYIKNRLIKPRT